MFESIGKEIYIAISDTIYALEYPHSLPMKVLGEFTAINIVC